MLQNLTKHIPLTTIIVSYFFICGGLYLIGFWTTFNVDISNLVSLADIPKSFIFPFVISQGFFLFNLLTNVLTAPLLKDPLRQPKTESHSFWRRLLRIVISIDFFILLASIFIINYYYQYKMNASFWLLSSLALAILLSIKFDNNTTIKTLIPYYTLRTYIVNTVVSVPFLSFALGKANSLNIYNNKDSRYIKIIATTQPENSDKNLLKFVGFLGDKLIGSSDDNKTITFINQSSFDQVEIVNKK